MEKSVPLGAQCGIIDARIEKWPVRFWVNRHGPEATVREPRRSPVLHDTTSAPQLVETLTPTNLTVGIGFFSSRTDTQPVARDLPLSDLARLLSHHDMRPAKDGPMFSCVRYRAGARRGNAGVIEATAITLDIDQEPEWFLLEPYAYVAFTTHRHTPEAPRWRIVLFLAAPIAPADWSEAWRRVTTHLAPNADPGAKGLAQAFYLPSCPPGSEPATRDHPGALLDWQALAPIPEIETATGPGRLITVGGGESGAFEDAALVEHARGAKNGAKFARLYAGDRSGYATPSQADQALANELAFWTDDVDQIARLVAASGLNKPEKYQRRGYLARTAEKAIAYRTARYAGPVAPMAGGALALVDPSREDATPDPRDAIIAQLRAENARLRAQQSATLQVLHREDMPIADRAILVGTLLYAEQSRQMAAGPPLKLQSPQVRALFADGWELLPPMESIASGMAIKRDAASRVLKKYAGIGGYELRTETLLFSYADPTMERPRIEPHKRLMVHWQGDGGARETIALAAGAPLAEGFKKSGGKREPTPRCPDCGGKLTWHRERICQTCAHLPEVEDPQPAADFPLPQKGAVGLFTTRGYIVSTAPKWGNGTEVTADYQESPGEGMSP